MVQHRHSTFFAKSLTVFYLYWKQRYAIIMSRGKMWIWKDEYTYIPNTYTCMYHTHTHTLSNIHVVFKVYINVMPWSVKDTRICFSETHLQIKFSQLHLVPLERCCLLVIFFHILPTVTENLPHKGSLVFFTYLNKRHMYFQVFPPAHL